MAQLQQRNFRRTLIAHRHDDGADPTGDVDLRIPPCVQAGFPLSPWKNAAWHHGADRVRRRTPLLIQLRIPSIILTISEAIRREAIEYFRLPPQAIAAVPLAAADSLRPVEPRPGIEPYFLYAGTLEPRKNIATLIAAWRLAENVA